MPKAPPVVARVRRGAHVESRHRGDGAVVDEDGHPLADWGDPSLPVFLRSAAKPFQALPLLEGGGGKRFRLSSRDIALICASHGGKPSHVRGVRRLLERGGFAPNALVCGPHLPIHEPSAMALLSRGERPTRLHNNCSGKHAGLLLACRLLALPPDGYWRPSHPLQLAIRRRLAELGSFPETDIDSAIDGCGLAVFRLPLSAIALAYARLLARRIAGESVAQARARSRVVSAMWERPEMVAGSGFFTTEFLRAGRNRWIGKEGAEAVYAVGVRAGEGGGRAAGIALKVEDGSARARPAVTLALMREMGWLTASARRALAEHESPSVRNSAGAVVGSIEAEVPIIRRDAAG
ncbi:MAG TPA: asparaginase [Thermoanaerobaculia bacterium]